MLRVSWETVEAPLLRLSLQRRIAVFVFSILLAVFVAFGLLGREALDHSTHSTLQEREATAKVVAAHLDTFIGHAHTHLLVTARDLAELPGAPSADTATPVLSAAHRQLTFFFAHLLVVDRNLRLVAATPSGGSLGDLSEAARAAVDQSLEAGRPTISNLVRLPVVEEAYGVLFVAPIVRGGSAVGALVGEMRLPHPAIYSVASSLQLGDTGHLEVVDGTGQVLASTSPEAVFRPSEHTTFYAPLLANRTSTVDRARYEDRDADSADPADRDEWHIMAFVPLGSAPWGVGLGQSEAETFATAGALRDHALAMATGAMAVALCFAWLGTRSVVRPIGALTRAGERMAAGDLSHPIQVTQPDEIGRLATVLERMRQHLGRSLAEIRAWNRQLEDRVQERTRALETSNRHLQTLMAVASATSGGSVDRVTVLRRALQELVPTLNAQAGWASLWDEERHELRPVAAYPANSDLPAATACWSAPIRVGEHHLGCLIVATDGRALTSDELALLDGVAGQAAIAFDNARLAAETARLEAARRLDMLRAEFLGSVSHELRTPLGFIKGYASTLLRQDVHWSAAQQRELLEIIDEESDHLTELVDNLLDAARLQSGRLKLTCAATDVAAVVRRSIERMNGALAERKVETHVRGPLPAIIADGTRLEQVVLNLLQNAVRYSPAEAPIEIEIQPYARGVRLSVLDRGSGLSAAEAEHIFEPFYRGPSAAGSQARGAGLGLAICRSIIEAHAGHIWAEPRPDGGTAIRLALPERPDAGEGDLHAA